MGQRAYLGRMNASYLFCVYSLNVELCQLLSELAGLTWNTTTKLNANLHINMLPFRLPFILQLECKRQDC